MLSASLDQTAGLDGYGSSTSSANKKRRQNDHFALSASTELGPAAAAAARTLAVHRRDSGQCSGTWSPPDPSTLYGRSTPGCTRSYCVEKTTGGYSRSFMVDLLSEIRPITFTLQTSCGFALSRHERDLAAPRRSAFGVRVGDGRETCGRGGRGVRPWQPPAESGAAHQAVAAPS